MELSTVLVKGEASWTITLKRLLVVNPKMAKHQKRWEKSQNQLLISTQVEICIKIVFNFLGYVFRFTIFHPLLPRFIHQIKI